MLLEGCINVLHYGLRHPVLTDDDDGLHVMRLGPKPAQLLAAKFAHGGGCNPIRQCGWKLGSESGVGGRLVVRRHDYTSTPRGAGSGRQAPAIGLGP